MLLAPRSYGPPVCRSPRCAIAVATSLVNVSHVRPVGGQAADRVSPYAEKCGA